LVRQIRKVDLAGRWGGEEFVVALTGADAAGGLVSAERIRVAIAAMEVRDSAGDPIPVTVSIGVASYEKGDHVDGLIDRADRAMYAAKSSGQNRVTAAREPDREPASAKRMDLSGSEPTGGERDTSAPLRLD
jgi:diguanylate cyclase (GGDEF)-like protein